MPRPRKPRAAAIIEDGKLVMNDPRFFSGSSKPAFGYDLIRQTLETLCHAPSADPDLLGERKLAAMAGLAAFHPKDEIEGMLAAQAVALHAATMDCFRRAAIPSQPLALVQEARKQGANLSRAFADVLAALDRKRGKARRQTVRVERVTVEAGGQAIVGNVTARGSGRTGGRHAKQTHEQPHAPPAGLAHDVAAGPGLSALQGEDPVWETVHGASDD